MIGNDLKFLARVTGYRNEADKLKFLQDINPRNQPLHEAVANEYLNEQILRNIMIFFIHLPNQ